MLFLVLGSIAFSIVDAILFGGWWLLLHLIPVIGFLVLLYFHIQRGEECANEYGPPPLRQR